MKNKTDTKEDRISRLAGYFSNMDINEEIQITPLSRKLDMHPNTIRNVIDLWEIFVEVGNIGIIRDRDKKIIRIVKKEDHKGLIEEIRENFKRIEEKIK